jgi:hypothetical protein
MKITVKDLVKKVVKEYQLVDCDLDIYLEVLEWFRRTER